MFPFWHSMIVDISKKVENRPRNGSVKSPKIKKKRYSSNLKLYINKNGDMLSTLIVSDKTKSVT